MKTNLEIDIHMSRGKKLHLFFRLAISCTKMNIQFLVCYAAEYYYFLSNLTSYLIFVWTWSRSFGT